MRPNEFPKTILSQLLGVMRGGWVKHFQHDQNIANADGATVRADINNALAALFSLSSGSSAPSTTIAYQLWADTTNALLKQRNAANTGWIVRGTLAESFVTSRSSNTILGVSDYGKPFRATSSFTQTLTAAATLGDGWFVPYRVESGATLTVDPNSSEQIDGAATKDFVGPCSGIIYCSGSAFFSYGFDNPAATQSVAGVIATATQAQQETATSTSVSVSPGVQHYHPSAPKAWGVVTYSGGTPSLGLSYNISSVTDVGTGVINFNFATSMSGATYAVLAQGSGDALNNAVCDIGTRTTGAVQIINRRTESPYSATDPIAPLAMIVLGDL